MNGMINSRRLVRDRIAHSAIGAALSLGFVATAAFAQPSTHLATTSASASSVAHARTLDAATIAAIEDAIRKDMAAQRIVGLGVAIADANGLVWEGAYGFEDREANIAASTATMYRWASVSKPMTAVAAMQLAKEGTLDLDADVRTLVPEFPDKKQTITARQLLCHQGGIVHYSNGKVIRTQREYAEEHPFKDCILALDMFKESPLIGVPGEQYAYTTHGYMLLGAVVERAAKKPFAEVVHQHIATPLGMTSLRPDYQWEEFPHRAKGYRKLSGDIRESTNTDVSWKLAGGGWISTAGDMARFGGGVLGTKLVDRETRSLMWTRQTTSRGERTGYGLGFSLAERAGVLEISHGGSQEKAKTELRIYPCGEDGIAVAVMCNSEWVEPGGLAREVGRITLASLGLKQDRADPPAPPRGPRAPLPPTPPTHAPTPAGAGR